MFTFSGYRYLPLEKNVLFYSIDEAKKEVLLLRLFSVNEDFMQKFSFFINEKDWFFSLLRKKNFCSSSKALTYVLRKLRNKNKKPV